MADAVRAFDAALPAIRPADCSANAERFAAERFRAEFSAFIANAWAGREVPPRPAHN